MAFASQSRCAHFSNFRSSFHNITIQEEGWLTLFISSPTILATGNQASKVEI
jgi:hypothetical protein